MRTETRGRYLPMRNLVLRTLAATGVIGVALVAPNMLQLLKKLDRAAAGRARLHQRIRHALMRLEHQEYITVTKMRGERNVELTPKGEQVLEKIYAEEYAIPEPAFWDGKWRIVMFDVREKRKKAREKLRLLLSGAGFLRLQDSVWVHPYPCDEFVGLLRAHLKSGTGEMLSLTADALESDKRLREHFKLV